MWFYCMPGVILDLHPTGSELPANVDVNAICTYAGCRAFLATTVDSCGVAACLTVHRPRRLRHDCQHISSDWPDPTHHRCPLVRV